jgi:hypothetical protein
MNYRRQIDDRLLWSTGLMVIETAATEGATRLEWLKDDLGFQDAVSDEVEKRRAEAGVV